MVHRGFTGIYTTPGTASGQTLYTNGNRIEPATVYRNLYHASDCAVEFRNPSKDWKTFFGFKKMPVTLEFFGQHLKAPSSVQLLSQSSHPWCIQLKTYFWPLSNSKLRCWQYIQSFGLGGPPRRRALPLLPFFFPPDDPLTVVAAKAAANASPRLVG